MFRRSQPSDQRTTSRRVEPEWVLVLVTSFNVLLGAEEGWVGFPPSGRGCNDGVGNPGVCV